MPLPNEILVARFNRLAQRLFNIQSVPAVAQLEDTLHLGLELPLDAENRFLLDDVGYAAFVTQVAVAGQLSQAGVINPAASGYICEMQRVFVAAGAAESIQGTIDPSTPLAQSGVTIALDTRALTPAVTGGPVYGGQSNRAAFGDPVILLASAPAGSATVEVPIPDVILTPGHSFALVGATANTALNALFWFRVRPVQPMELAR